ncbi:hypothetical protein Ddye_024540 [Dipteronia dyeriana]|uniref:Uncharacterized protein n=1 Tax=Dipteronia dyeriana TaxID=168575 RepID=A0AAD9TVI0_9ROSI|nr:hypothetical protein Ddye_024540 [Dipteronia dyeriana]
MKTVITHMQKQRITSILNWVSSNFVENRFASSKPSFGPIYIAQNPRLYRTKTTVFSDGYVSQVSPAIRREAQGALLEYLLSTRSLQFLDAEHMSKNSPHFIEQLLKQVQNAADIKGSITRYLRYHPINEFELFFESLGLEPFEYRSLLPRDLMFLSDDELLLENYYVLCNYGIARSKIGKIYKQAMEVFRYDFGVLQSKLQAYEELGLNQFFISKVIVCSPYLLIGGVHAKFVEVLTILKSMGIELSWIEENLLEQDSYNWSMILSVLRLFSKIGFSEEQLSGLIRQHPGLIFEGSENQVLTLIAFLLKYGTTMNEIRLMFLQFPQIQVGFFFLNLKNCLMLLFEIEMELDEIGKIIGSHAMFMGSLTLKKPSTILSLLNVGRKRLCEHIQENPLEMKKWVMGSKIEPLPKSGDKERSPMLVTKFLIDLGFAENSNEMEKALKVFRGRGEELQERFDCIVNAGLDRQDVCKMIRLHPRFLNQKKSVIELKIDLLVNGLCYPVSHLVTFPAYFDYTVQRIQLRMSMYNWLKDQGVEEPMLPLSTIIGCSQKVFMQRFVKTMFMFEIGKIVRSHALFMGSLTFKKPNTILSLLNVGRKRLYEHIMENPPEMKKWVMGSNMEPLPKSGEKERSQMLVTKFLIDVGFAENSNEMEKALKVFRGRGGELQERFDCIVKAGLDRQDVCKMVRLRPRFLNKKKSVIELKIDLLVNGLGYPVSHLVTFPAYLDYTVQRIILRMSMYNWLKDQGVEEPMLPLSTIIGCSQKVFMQRFVNQHLEGHQVWQNLKKQICTEYEKSVSKESCLGLRVFVAWVEAGI